MNIPNPTSHPGLAMLNRISTHNSRENTSKPPDSFIPRALPKQPAQLRSSQCRPASSVYSQSSILQPQFVPVTSVNIQASRPHIADCNNVSPPSSPEALFPRDANQNSPEISPVDEVLDMFQVGLDKQGELPQPESLSNRSQIPMMRRERRQKQEQQAQVIREVKSRERLRDRENSSRQSRDPRREPTIGGITGNATSRPSQVKPLQYTHKLGISGDGSKSPPSMAAFGERMMKRKIPAKQFESIDLRPPWNGASGRTTIVAPVKDTANVSPLRIPPKSDMRSTNRNRSSCSPASPETGQDATSSTNVERLGADSPVSPAAIQSGAQAYPSPPHSNDPLYAGIHTGAANQARSASPLSHSQLHGRSDTLREETPSIAQSQSFISVAPSIVSISAPPVEEPRQSSTTCYPNHDSPHLTMAKNASHKSWSSSIYSQATNVAPHASHPPLPNLHSSNSPIPTKDEWVQPTSRFSVTTYATSTADSPRPSQDKLPPIPNPLQQYSSMEGFQSKTMREPARAKTPEGKFLANPITKRSPAFVASPTKSGPLRSNPVTKMARSQICDIQDEGSGIKTASVTKSILGGSVPRDDSTSPSTPDHSPSVVKFSSAFRERRVSASSTNKDLPPVPAEKELSAGGDRVAILNVRLEALANRRININRSIKQMTELMPADNILASAAVLAKREEEKKKVAALKRELADVQREEYELGLKLHRAYKRQDREANYESTSLWVKRASD